MTLPPYPAIGKARVEIFGPDSNAARWDQASWDNATWVELGWRDVTPQAMVVKVGWGADDPAGVLTTPAAGAWDITTYDPDRILDPTNGSSPYAASLRPGRPMRVSYWDGTTLWPVRAGLIDEVEYDLKAKTGAMRGTDLTPLLVHATLEGVESDPGLPDTLRARARWLVARAGLGLLVPVEPDPAEIADPPVGPLSDDKLSCWSLIGTSAYDCLHAVWIDRHGILRFRSFAEAVGNGFTIGGDDGIPLASLTAQSSIAEVHNVIRAFDITAPDVPVIAADNISQQLYGIIPLTREKPVPLADQWVASVLADRSGASLQYKTGTIYPRTHDELMAVLELEMMDAVTIVADDLTPPLSLAARCLGARITADTDTGWTAEVISYIPAKEWDAIEEPPTEPPDTEPPPGTHQETRTYNATKDTRAAKDSGGNNLGSGTEGELPVGSWQGWRNRAFIDFADIPWSKVVSVDECILNLDTSTQVNIGFGSSPKVYVDRVTESWSEGTASSPSGSNATKYPGPACSTSGRATKAVTGAENTAVSINITAIARAWFGGSAQHGVRIISAGEDAPKYTTEFWSRENSTSGKRPSLTLKVTVQD